MADERLGFVGIVIEDRKTVQIPVVNGILSEFGDMIRGRIGVPEADAAVIGLIVRGSNDRVGALTGRLGNLKGVQVKSALTSIQKAKE